MFEGYFYDNEKYGPCVEIYENGNLFLGEFLNNKKHGKGKFYWFSLGSNSEKKIHSKNTEFYDGEWWGGLPDGYGIHQKANGNLFLL